MQKFPSFYLLGLLLPVMSLPLGCGDDPTSADDVGDTGATGESDSEVGTEDSGDVDTLDDPTETTGDGDGDTGDGDGDGDGDPLPDAPVGEWLYVEIEGMFCRDGSPAGVGVRYSDDPSRLSIYMEGGGACFNAFTCAANPSSVPAGKFDSGPNGGIFSTSNPDNPLADDNFIYFPYCTGDVFFGSNPSGDISGGPQDQMFVGHSNVLLALDRITDTFPQASTVTALGESGGGFGVASNYDTIAMAFPDVDVTLVDDSAPIFRDQYLAPCLQQIFRDTWGIDASLPEDCAACFGPDGGGLWNYLPFIAEKYPTAVHTIISSEADATISSFYGFGNQNCMALFPSFPEFEEALYDMRDTAMTAPSWGSFIKTGNSHTYLSGDSTLYGTTSGGVVLSDWLVDVLNGNPTHVDPG